MGIANLAHINPEVISWGLNRRGVTADEIATKQVTAKQIEAWQKRQALPTHKQAQALAEKLRIPFLVLFLSTPPSLELEIPDLRTVSGRPEVAPSLEFMQVINDALVRQDWYRELQRNRAARTLPFVGSFASYLDVNAVARDITNKLAIDQMRAEARSWQDFLDKFISRAESLGVLVFRSAIVGHATNKRLLVKEFRGFVLSDPLAPIIFINDDDAKAAQTFTLAHELAHIWIGSTGISDPHLTMGPAELVNTTERFCNQVAAEVLVPAVDFNAAWTPLHDLRRNLSALGTRYRVSSLVLLIRARELGKISEPTFSAHFDAAMARFREQDKKDKLKEKENDKKQGGQFWYSFVIRNSKTFADVVVTAAKEGKARFTEAASLLGVSPSTFERYLERLQKQDR
jgi:Zn-dependent peptidase ImmA (M78 family)